MTFDRRDLSSEQLISFYRSLLWPRMIEEKMLVLLRQGKISKWFSGIGQEAIAVGATLALQEDEWIMPLHRNLGVFTTRNMPLHKLFMQWQGAKEGYSKGRERSFHFGNKEHHICGMISHLGPQLAIADGVALAHKLRKENKVSLAFTGEGGTSEGDFHEALNVAAVWDLPVIFIIENNGYGLSTPVNEQYRCISLVDKAKGYGMEGVMIDGNNILNVYDTIKGVRDFCIKNQKPYLIECMTFRMRGFRIINNAGCRLLTTDCRLVNIFQLFLSIRHNNTCSKTDRQFLFYLLLKFISDLVNTFFTNYTHGLYVLFIIFYRVFQLPYFK